MRIITYSLLTNSAALKNCRENYAYIKAKQYQYLLYMKQFIFIYSGLELLASVLVALKT